MNKQWDGQADLHTFRILLTYGIDYINYVVYIICSAQCRNLHNPSTLYRYPISVLDGRPQLKFLKLPPNAYKSKLSILEKLYC